MTNESIPNPRFGGSTTAREEENRILNEIDSVDGEFDVDLPMLFRFSYAVDRRFRGDFCLA